jgi:glycosyltransferase involved in cell wall biosynthesis
VVYNGVDMRLFHPGPREAARERVGIADADPLLLFVGNLVAVKGLDVLMDALATLLSLGTKFQCAILGEGPLKADLRSRINARGLGARVRLMGPRPLEELSDWYRAADLVVLPSRSEGVPNVLLEAIACQTPFVATRVGGIPEIASADSLVQSDNASLLADRIGSSLRSPRKLVSPFVAGSWADSARALAAVLNAVVATSGTHHRQAA